MGPRAGLDGCGNISPPTEFRSPDRPNRTESLYQLRYPNPQHITVFSRKITTLFVTALTNSSIIVSTEIVTPYPI